MELLNVNGTLNKKSLARHIVLPVVGGLVTGWLANRNAQEKYQKLNQPSFSPPGVVFPIAWTVLYGMMGLAKYRVKQKK